MPCEDRRGHFRPNPGFLCQEVVTCPQMDFDTRHRWLRRILFYCMIKFCFFFRIVYILLVFHCRIIWLALFFSFLTSHYKTIFSTWTLAIILALDTTTKDNTHAYTFPIKALFIFVRYNKYGVWKIPKGVQVYIYTRLLCNEDDDGISSSFKPWISALLGRVQCSRYLLFYTSKGYHVVAFLPPYAETFPVLSAILRQERWFLFIRRRLSSRHVTSRPFFFFFFCPQVLLNEAMWAGSIQTGQRNKTEPIVFLLLNEFLSSSGIGILDANGLARY